MGISKITVWLLIRRYDRLEGENDKLQTFLQQVTLESELTFDDLKLTIFCLVHVEDDGSRVLKIRRHDNNLIPFSSLLDGSTKDKPFFVDVVRVHQYCGWNSMCNLLHACGSMKNYSQKESNSIIIEASRNDVLQAVSGVCVFSISRGPPRERSIPPGYVEALTLKLNNLEKRVMLVENEIPQLEDLRITAIEDVATQLSTCVGFLDRRLDELAPPHWKAQIGTSI